MVNLNELLNIFILLHPPKKIKTKKIPIFNIQYPTKFQNARNSSFWDLLFC